MSHGLQVAAAHLLRVNTHQHHSHNGSDVQVQFHVGTVELISLNLQHIHFHLYSYLMLRSIRRAWLVFMAARAASNMEIRCRRVLRSVWRTLCSVQVSRPLVRSSRIVSMGITWWRSERLANWKGRGTDPTVRRDREKKSLKSEYSDIYSSKWWKHYMCTLTCTSSLHSRLW